MTKQEASGGIPHILHQCVLQSVYIYMVDCVYLVHFEALTFIFVSDIALTCFSSLVPS